MSKDNKAHTPGPWKIVNRIGELHGTVSLPFMFIAADEKLGAGWIAEMAPAVNTEANARLIAKAPAMLQALKDIQIYLDHPEGNSPNGMRLNDAREIIKQAISQIEGGTT